MKATMNAQERKLDAAEYVIGTLTPAEHAAFEVLVASDPQTRIDVEYWERVFGTLNAGVAPEAPPKEIWDRIEEALLQRSSGEQQVSALAGGSAAAVAPVSAQPANDNLAAKLQRSRSRWRMMAIAASIAALGLGAFIMQERVNLSGQNKNDVIAGLDGKKYIAVVNASGDQPSLVVNVDAKTGEITVRRIGVETPQGKSLELWYLPGGENAVSVGILGGNTALKDITPRDGDVLAISVEPVGGSPTGTATGPIIYTGKLVENVNAD